MPLPSRLKTLVDSWATRSLMVGAVATGIDLAVGGLIITFWPDQSRAAAMIGTLFGATFAYFANRRFAFRDQSKVQTSAWRYVLSTAALSTVHGQVMVIFRDHFHIPYALAKVSADVLVFTFTQLIIFRFFVFAKGKQPQPPPAE